MLQKKTVKMLPKYKKNGGELREKYRLMKGIWVIKDINSLKNDKFTYKQKRNAAVLIIREGKRKNSKRKLCKIKKIPKNYEKF